MFITHPQSYQTHIPVALPGTAPLQEIVICAHGTFTSRKIDSNKNHTHLFLSFFQLYVVSSVSEFRFRRKMSLSYEYSNLNHSNLNFFGLWNENKTFLKFIEVKLHGSLYYLSPELENMCVNMCTLKYIDVTCTCCNIFLCIFW